MANVVILQTIREDAYIQTVINQNLPVWVDSRTEEQRVAAGSNRTYQTVTMMAVGSLQCRSGAAEIQLMII